MASTGSARTEGLVQHYLSESKIELLEIMNADKTLFAVALGAGLLSVGIVNANVISYTSLVAYNTATSGNKLINFEAQALDPYATHYGSLLTVGGVTFTDNEPRLFVLSGGHHYGDPFTSNYLNNNNYGTKVGVSFTNPVYGFAMDFGTIYNWGGGPLQTTFSFAGQSKTFSYPGILYSGGAPLSFIGFTSDVAFSSISINDPTKGLAIDNFTYAKSVNAQIPEPATIALMGLGILGIAVTRSRKQKIDA